MHSLSNDDILDTTKSCPLGRIYWVLFRSSNFTAGHSLLHLHPKPQLQMPTLAILELNFQGVFCIIAFEIGWR